MYVSEGLCYCLRWTWKDPSNLHTPSLSNCNGRTRTYRVVAPHNESAQRARETPPTAGEDALPAAWLPAVAKINWFTVQKNTVKIPLYYKFCTIFSENKFTLEISKYSGTYKYKFRRCFLKFHFSWAYHSAVASTSLSLCVARRIHFQWPGKVTDIDAPISRRCDGP